MHRVLLFLVLLCWVGGQASSFVLAAIYTESINGDLSGQGTNPTNLGTYFAGSHNVIGGTIASPIDRDFWTISIPANHRLDSIVLAAFTSNDNRSFFAVANGTSLSAINDANLLLGGTYVGDAAGRLVNDNLLDDLAARVHIGGVPLFSGPLGPGSYTFWSQGNSTNPVNETVTYNYQFNVSATPEPSSTTLAVVAIIGVAYRRNRDRLVRNQPYRKKIG